MQSLTQVKLARELIEEMRTVTRKSILERGTEADVAAYERRINEVLNAGSNPTLPTLKRLLEKAKKCGFTGVVRIKELR